MFSIITFCLLFVLFLVIFTIFVFERLFREKKCTDLEKCEKIEKTLSKPPSPMKLPIIGHMHLLGGYDVPYKAFKKLGSKYGNVIHLQLGSVKCVIVNEQKNIREALVTKGHHFDSRPNFERYRKLFSGNKEYSLAFCDWSSMQKVRRDMLRAYTFPRAFTNNYISLDHLIMQEANKLTHQISQENISELKPILLKTCANIFLNHFCSINFSHNDQKFEKMVENFDEVFYEVNQGYAADFLPFLMPLHEKKLQKMNMITEEIKDFINSDVIQDKYETYNPDIEPQDYLESLIGHVKMENAKNAEPAMDWEMALFALEDIIGGHSAVGNFLIKLFAFLVNEPNVQRKVQEEIKSVVGDDPLNVCNRNQMVYTEAVIYEAIRLIASPIVPRVANQNSSIDGFEIEKGTMLFLNNYDLSMSTELWKSPEKFIPERFIRNGKLFKPEYFLPFGGGRRSCMGYKLVQLVSFGILGCMLQNFNIKPLQNQQYTVPVGSLALKKDTFKFCFEKRCEDKPCMPQITRNNEM